MQLEGIDLMRYSSEMLKNFGVEVLKKIGLNDHKAKIFMDSITLAEMRGVRSHGFTRFKTYVDRIQAGEVSVTADPQIVRKSDSVMVINGNNGPGITVGIFAMEECIKRAAKTGACFAAVNHSSHYGFGGYYAMYAAERNMIGFSACNTNATVVPFGGAKSMLGTNPLSIAVPGGKSPGLVLDMATSVVAKGKVQLAQKLGKKIPDGWGVDKNGNPTSNAAKVLEGALLPFGGAKGYAIALMIDVFCSALSGAKNSRQIRAFFNCEDPEGFKNIGFFMGAIDISKFVDIDLFKERIDSVYAEFKACPPAPGVSQVMLPGEIEQLNYERNATEGIELSETIVKELSGMAEYYGVTNLFDI